MKRKLTTRLRITLQSVLCVFLALLLANPAAAVLSEATLDFYNINGIYYYNPSGVGNSFGCYSGDIVIAGTTPEEKVWSGLTSFMTPEQAAGTMGNMAHEGNYFNPVQHEVSQMNALWNTGFNIINDSSKAYGIGLIQWSFGRRTNLLQYIEKSAPHLIQYFTQPEIYSKGYSVNGKVLLSMVGDAVYDQLILIELEFLRDELQNNSSYRKLFEQQTVIEAADYFLERIEKPADPEASRAVRRADAEKYYNQLNGIALTPSAGTGCSSSGTLQELTLKYAWPTYHQASFVEMMPDYATAVQQQKASGKYAGGINYPGVDCGGFVTILMQNSGFEPNYNSGKGGTTTQEAWVKSHGWVLLNASEDTYIETNILQPGDVAFVTGHTFVYVGNIPGFDSNIASASLDERAPMAGRESLTYDKDRGEVVRWYRKGNVVE